MLTWIVVAVVAFVVGSALAFRLGRRRGLALGGGAARGALGSADASGPLLDRTVADVRVDDVVQLAGTDWLVEGVVEYEEDGHRWRSARMVDGGKVRWLLVNLDRGERNVRVLEPAHDVELTGYPPETIVRGDTSFSLARRGTANAVVHGDLGDLPGSRDVQPGYSVRCRWWRYGTAGDAALVIEQWGETYRALAGQAVKLDDVELLAAS